MGIDIRQYFSKKFAPESYDWCVAKLINELRGYVNRSDDAMLPALPGLEAQVYKIQCVDDVLGEPQTDYIKEILDQLRNEQTNFKRGWEEDYED